MSRPRPLWGVPSNVFRIANYQITPSPRGIPMVQLELAFHRPSKGILPAYTFPSCTSNPEMTLAVVLDKSGSMQETFSAGHVYNCTSTILNHVRCGGAGYDLVFYSNYVSDAGHIKDDGGLRNAIRMNQPTGGTYVTDALDTTIRKYKNRRGIYVIVITDGEFQDKIRVQQYVLDNILSHLTWDNPYAYRLHFVGAGEGADEKFLHQLETLCSGQGFQLVSAHHHAHLSHSHNDLLDEIDRAFLGPGSNIEIGETSAFHNVNPDECTVIGVGDVNTRRWREGPRGQFDFLPRHMTIGFEFKPLHPAVLPVTLRFRNTVDQQMQSFDFQVPLPAISGPGIGQRLWSGVMMGDAQDKKRLEAETKEAEEAALRRQGVDLESLASGGIPVAAVERLSELREQDGTEKAIFTSNLAPDELALLRRHGFRARGLVTGSAIYHVGAAFASMQDCEVRQLSQAYDTATELAVNRMRKELEVIGAHGVIGVRLNLIRHEWSEEKTIEVQAMGTAIEQTGKPPRSPWMSDLSAQEWWALYRAGYEPAGIVWGHCSWFVITTDQNMQILRSWQNQELSNCSDALSRARHIALDHAKSQLKELQAIGITGVKIERRLSEVRIANPGGQSGSLYRYEHHNLLVSIIGTAIRPREGAPQKVPGTVHVLSLRDGRLTPAVLKQEADFKVSD